MFCIALRYTRLEFIVIQFPLFKEKLRKILQAKAVPQIVNYKLKPDKAKFVSISA